MNKKVSGKRPGPVVLDVVGKQLDAEDMRRIAHPLTGGVILFARNFESRAQLTALTRAIRAVREDVLICIDHEGGRVQRAKTDGFTHLPAMARLGELWDRDVMTATKVAIACGYVLAAELRACDIDLSFTPVLDLDHGRSAVIGDRAFHADPRVVTMLANHLTHGLLLAGMSNCGKHFPGHGFVEADLARGRAGRRARTSTRFWPTTRGPYDWMGNALASVMPAHVIYPKVDPNPAGFSPFWLQDVAAYATRLRGRDLQRRPEHGRRQRGRHGDPGRAGRARCGVRHGADLQPSRARRPAARRNWTRPI